MNNITFEFKAIGTQWKIVIFDDISENNKKEVFQKIKDRVETFEETYSRFRKTSLITKISQSSGLYEFPEDSLELFSIYRKFFDITSGLVTPLIGQVISDAGYDASYSFKEKKIFSPLEWDDVLEFNYPYLKVKKPILLDFGAGGKGYIVDIVSNILKKEGIKKYFVDAGGDISYKTSDSMTLKVGLENPLRLNSVIGVSEILNQSIAGSSGNRRKWGRFHHIINPKTLSSPDDIIALWVIGENTFISDMLATSLFFVSKEELEEHFKFDYLIIRKDFSFDKSNGFIAEMFIE